MEFCQSVSKEVALPLQSHGKRRIQADESWVYFLK